MIFKLIGWTLIGGLILYTIYPIFINVIKAIRLRSENKEFVKRLKKCFISGEFNKSFGDKVLNPSLINFNRDQNRLVFKFSIPKGLNPDLFDERSYVFKQYFGKNIKLFIDISYVELEVFNYQKPDLYNTSDNQ